MTSAYIYSSFQTYDFPALNSAEIHLQICVVKLILFWMFHILNMVSMEYIYPSIHLEVKFLWSQLTHI
jgi:hypothetical protein